MPQMKKTGFHTGKGAIVSEATSFFALRAMLVFYRMISGNPSVNSVETNIILTTPPQMWQLKLTPNIP